MTNAFGVDDPRVSKGLPSYLRALASSKTEEGLHSASPAIRRAVKYGDKKDIPDTAKGARKVAAKHPDGMYMLTRIYTNKVGQDASRAKALGYDYAGKRIKQGRKGKALTQEIADTRLSKGVPKGLRMVATAGQSRSSIAGGVKRGDELVRRMSAGKKAGKATPHGLFSQTQLGRMKEDPFR